MSISGLAVAALDSSGGLLAEFRASQERAAAEQVWQVELALQFCAFNSPDSISPAASLPGTEGEVSLAGAGAPEIAEFAVVEFAAVAGMSSDAARLYLGRCLEVGHRLPRVFAALRAGRVPVWRALRIADHTLRLPVDGAAWVDGEVADVAGRVGTRVLERLAGEAVVRFDPETAARQAAEALEHRHATVIVDQPVDALLATGRLDAVLDAADALDLDATLADFAADLAAAGDKSSLDVRRAKALGLLARGETPELSGSTDGTADGTIDGNTDGALSDPTCSRPANAPSSGSGRTPVRAVPRRRREVVLHVHLAHAALNGSRGGSGDGSADRVRESIAGLCTPTGRPLGQVTVEQVRHWCATPGAMVTVKPVLDLTETLRSSGYQPSGRVRDHVVATNPTCAFPWCTRPAGGLDLDHIRPYDPDDPDQGGETSTDNLAPLCRRHHRAKTHGGWRYVRLGPGEHLWTSPHGYQWVTDADGTRDATG